MLQCTLVRRNSRSRKYELAEMVIAVVDFKTDCIP